MRYGIPAGINRSNSAVSPSPRRGFPPPLVLGFDQPSTQIVRVDIVLSGGFLDVTDQATTFCVMDDPYHFEPGF